MSHAPDIQNKAETLFVEQNLSVPEIATRLGVPAQTVYRWRNEAKAKGEQFDWDEQRNIFHMSPQSLVNIYAKTFRRWILKMQKNIDILADAQVADAIAKHVSSLKKLDPRFGYLGAILDVIKIADQYLAETDPKMREQMEKHWPAIQERIRTIASRESPL